MRLRLIILLVILLTGACKKKQDPSQLILGTWKMTAGTSYILVNNQPVGGLLDWFSNQPSCQKDNTYTFRTDGTLLIDEGAEKCEPDAPQTTSIEYRLINDQTLIIGNLTYRILSLSASTLRIQREVVTAIDESSLIREISEETYQRLQ